MSLTTEQVLACLLTSPATKKYVLGVFPCDQLPANPARPGALVVNTDPAHEPGSHWIAIYLDNSGGGDYFDSYGVDPHNKHIRSWLDKYCTTGLRINRTQVQSPLTSTCGQHCLWMLVNLCQNRKMNRVAALFNNNTFAYDCFVSVFVNKHFGLVTSVFDRVPKCNGVQCCTQFRME